MWLRRQVLQQLGAKGEPGTADLVALLVESGAKLKGRRMNVNEQRAVLRLVECIVAATPPAGQEERTVGLYHSLPRHPLSRHPQRPLTCITPVSPVSQIRQAARRGEVFLPDCSSRLAVCSSCIHCGRGVQTSRLLARIDPLKVRLVHPSVPERMCAMLGVPSLERIAVEQLDDTRPLLPLDAIQALHRLTLPARSLNIV
jgi:hypothetical protein